MGNHTEIIIFCLQALGRSPGASSPATFSLQPRTQSGQEGVATGAMD